MFNWPVALNHAACRTAPIRDDLRYQKRSITRGFSQARDVGLSHVLRFARSVVKSNLMPLLIIFLPLFYQHGSLV